MKTQQPVHGVAFLCELPALKFADGDPKSQAPFVDGDWTQLAKSGTFYSPVYGQIDLEPTDLETMFRNFKTRTPVAPTRLPIDYDHLSDEPKKPGDGQAAGWINDLKLAPDADGKAALWMKPSWTRDAAKLIAEGKYAGISPFFVTDFLDKLSGKKIGPTLRAAALTNRPFLEGMANVPIPSIAMRERTPRLAMLREAGASTTKPGSAVPQRWLSELRTQSSTRQQGRNGRNLGVAMNEQKTCACGAPLRKGTDGVELSFADSKVKWAEELAEQPAPPALTCPHCGAPVKHHVAESAPPAAPAEGDDKVSLEQEMTEPIDNADADDEEALDDDAAEGLDGEGSTELDEANGDADSLDLGDMLPVKDDESEVMPPATAMREKPAQSRSLRETRLEEQVRQLSERAAAAERKLKVAQQQERRGLAEQLVRDGLRQGKLTPKLIGTWQKPGWALSEAYSRPKAFKEWLRTTAPVLVDLEERGTGKEPENVTVANTAARINELAMSEITKHPGLSYADAVRRVQTEHRSLAEAYDREMSRPAGEVTVRALSDRTAIR